MRLAGLCAGLTALGYGVVFIVLDVVAACTRRGHYRLLHIR